MAKSGENWRKVGKMAKSWNKWGKLGKRGEKWQKVAKWRPPAILDDRKSLLIAFLAISDQYVTLLFFKMAAGGSPKSDLRQKQ